MDKRRLILDKAKELIGRLGFKKTTMEDIARALGMGKASLYYYFNSKEDILREIIESEGEKLREMIEKEIKKAKNAKDKLKRYAITRFKFLRQLGIYYTTIKDELYKNLDFIERERRKFDAFDFNVIKSILDEGVKDGEFKPIDTEYYAYLLLVAIRALELPVVLGETFSPPGRKVGAEYAINTYLDILLYGIAY